MKRFILVASTVLAALLPFQASAISAYDLHAVIYDTNFYDKNSGDCTAAGGTAGTAASGNDNESQVWNYLTQQWKLQPFQAAALMGNAQAESHFDPHIIQGGGDSNDPTAAGGGGYGLFQWTPGSKLEDYLKGQTPTIANEVDTLITQLLGQGPHAEKGAGDAFFAATNLTAAEAAFENKYERHAGPPQPARLTFAQQILTKYGNGASATGSSGAPTGTGTSSLNTQGSSVATTDCSATGGGVVAGSIVQTAIGLAWPNPTFNAHNPKTPTDAYRAAWDGASDYTDCGAFVATVMIKSGADPSYPKVGTGVQRAYLLAHQDKYTIITDHNTSAFLPGDILVYNDGGPTGHTEIYTGAVPDPASKGLIVASASLGGHTPQMGNPGELAYILKQPGVIVARHK